MQILHSDDKMETEWKHTHPELLLDTISPPLARASSPLKQNSNKDPSRRQSQVLTILNTLHPELFIPHRRMGWNMFDTIRTTYPFIYRINDGMSNNILLQKVCEERGWKEYKEEAAKSKIPWIERELYSNSNWNLWWSYNFYQGSPYRTLKCWQYTNHNPRAFQFCNKSYLTSFLKKMRAEFGEVYDFSPKGFIMPKEYVQFVSEHSRRQERECLDARNIVMSSEMISPTNSDDVLKNKQSFGTRTSRHPVWIIKPIGKSQGKGIVLTKDIGMVAAAHRCVVQEYITRPFLIADYKWDIRIYVCITSTDPLVIYMYREGLCRFATEKFDLTNLDACFSHLTNASLNKFAPEYPTNKEIIGSGCKWSLKQLRAYLKKGKQRDWLLWQKIMSLVLLTVVGEGLKSGYVFPANRNCFDFFGFDILVDANFQPWLLEVNYSPGLGGDCEVDEIVKKPMLNELFDLLGFPNSSSDEQNIMSRPSPSTSKLSHSARQPQEKKHVQFTPKPKLALDCTNIDASCKARLKQASLIYSQDLVLEYFGKHCRDPKFRLSPTMKILYERKISHAKRKKRFDKLLKQMRNNEKNSKIVDEELDEEGSDDDSSDSSSNVKTPSSSRPSSANGEKSKKSDDSSYIYLQRQDWAEAPLKNGNWCLVYPCKAFPYRSPYRSALGDLRSIVKSIEQYMAIAESVVKTYPDQNDEFYESRVKALCRWNIEIWCPPGVEDDETIVPIMR